MEDATASYMSNFSRRKGFGRINVNLINWFVVRRKSMLPAVQVGQQQEASASAAET
jgi:hypothetical protein